MRVSDHLPDIDLGALDAIYYCKSVRWSSRTAIITYKGLYLYHFSSRTAERIHHTIDWECTNQPFNVSTYYANRNRDLY